jgi:hypothetical protein
LRHGSARVVTRAPRLARAHAVSITIIATISWGTAAEPRAALEPVNAAGAWTATAAHHTAVASAITIIPAVTATARDPWIRMIPLLDPHRDRGPSQQAAKRDERPEHDRGPIDRVTTVALMAAQAMRPQHQGDQPRNHHRRHDESSEN